MNRLPPFCLAIGFCLSGAASLVQAAANAPPEPVEALLQEGDFFYFHHLNDPINLRTGNLFQPAKDVELPAERGLPLAFERGYNSFHAQRRYALGKGWISTADRKAGFLPEEGAVFTLDASGAEIKFLPTAETWESWTALLIKERRPAPEEKTRLLNQYRRDRARLLQELRRLHPGPDNPPAGKFETASGRLQTLTVDANGYLYVDAAGRQLQFDRQGRLRAERDRAGAALEYDYEEGRLVAVRDSFQRRLSISWSQAGTISRLRDPRGREVVYTYSPDLYLTEVTLPGNRHFLYNYSKDGLLLRQTYPDQTVTENEFDNRQRAVAQRGPGKRVSRYTYLADAKTLTRTVEQPDGSKIEYFFERRSGRIAVHGPGSRREEYLHNARGLVAQEMRNGIAVRTFEYDGAGRPTVIRDALGRETRLAYHENCDLPQSIADERRARRYEYSADCRLTALTAPDGSRERFAYDAQGHLIARIGPLGETTALGYDAAGWLQSQTSPRGAVTRFEHDLLGRLTASVDPAGGRTLYVYDEADAPIRITHPNGATEEMAYDPMGRMLRRRGRLGETQLYRYDEVGNLIEAVGADGAKRQWQYDAGNRPLAEKDPLGQETRYQYSPEGRLTEVTNPLGQATGYSYDLLGNLISERRANGASVHFRYDRAGRLIQNVDPLGATTRYEFDDRQGTVAAINPLGGRTFFRFDLRDRLLEKETADGARWRLAYQAAGPVSEVQDPLGHRYRLTYDPDGHLTSVTNPAGASRQFTYDLAGRLLAARNENGHSTHYRYGKEGELLEAVRPDNSRLSFTYDAAGRLTSFKDARGALTQFRYDPAGRLAQQQDPLGKTTTYAYDPAGQLAKVTLANGRTQEYRYDPLGRLLSLRSAGTPLLAVEYDDAGQPRRLDNGRDRLEMKYDAAGRLLTETHHPSGTWVSYAYDTMGNRLSLRTQRGQEIRYRYNNAGQLQEVLEVASQAATHFTYDRRGWRQTIAYPQEVTGTFDYNAVGQVQAIAYQRSGQDLWRQQYQRDAVGNIVAIDGPLGHAAFEYDRLDRLVRASLPGQGLYAYRYDPAGNLLEQTTPRGKTAFRYDAANRLLRAGERKYEYDDLGQLLAVQVGEQRSEWLYDEGQRLTAVRKNGQETRFRYDPLGRLSEKSGAAERRYEYDGDALLAVADPKAKTEWQLIPALAFDDQLYLRGPEGVQLYLRDHLGSVVASLGKSGDKVKEIPYDPYGAPLSPKALPLLAFAGMTYEPEIGAYNARHRFYAPASGRFTSPDPLGLAGGVNTYAYAEGNPVNYTDPLGLATLAAAGQRPLPPEYRPSNRGGGISLTDLGLALLFLEVVVPWFGADPSISFNPVDNLLGGLLGKTTPQANPLYAARQAAGRQVNPFLPSSSVDPLTRQQLDLQERLVVAQKQYSDSGYAVSGQVAALTLPGGCTRFRNILTHQDLGTDCGHRVTAASLDAELAARQLLDQSSGINGGRTFYPGGMAPSSGGTLFSRPR